MMMRSCEYVQNESQFAIPDRTAWSHHSPGM